MEDLTAFGDRDYGILFGLLMLSRGMDFLSTWIATPNLILEANPLAKKLGWKWGGLLNLAVCGVFAFWPMPAIVIATTSILVAARNFQSAWLMHTMGEEAYRHWMVEKLSQTKFGLYLFCLLTQAMLMACVGAALLFFSELLLVPFGVGVGMVTYAIAVAFYSLLATWRARRTSRGRAVEPSL